jgi:hypothetical protein
MRAWISAGLDPSQLVRFQNLVDPWNSLLEPASEPFEQGHELSREYRFNGNFYSDDINFRNHPFGGLTLKVALEAVPTTHGASRSLASERKLTPSIAATPLRLQGDPQASSVSQRTNMTGYRLRTWHVLNEGRGIDMALTYEPLGRSALVKWLLPLTITMLVMLLTPSLRASFSSERLAIPPVILLTLVFLQQAYRDVLPTLPYLTGLDQLYAFSYAITLVFFCEFIWCANLRETLGERFYCTWHQRIRRLELAMQLLGLGCFGAVFAWAWTLS